MAPFIPSLASNGPQLGIFMGFTDPLATCLVAAAGYDFVIIDMEHNPLSAASATQTVHSVGSASRAKCTPLIRVPSHDPRSIIAIDHRVWKIGLPVRSAILKPYAGRPVVGWVTTSESLLLIVLLFASCILFLYILQTYLSGLVSIFYACAAALGTDYLTRSPIGVEWIKWGLDSGSAGLIVPMVQTPEDAAAIVKRGRYPPLGERSFGPSHTAFAHAHLEGGVAGYFANALDEKAPGIALIVMLESRLGVQNAEAIVGTEGISGAFVGPFDLRCSLGLTGGEGEEELFVNALKAVSAAGKKHGKPVGMMAPSKKAVKQGIELGYTFIAYQGDSTLLGMAAKASVKEGRDVIRNLKL